jgi:hypothetical protein
MKSEKQLYQWDVNQYLTELQPTAQFVDYPMGNEVIRIETEGKRCRIPDEFLQTAGFKTCYERYSDGTYKAYNFNVQSSPKPPDYVYTAEERITFDALVAKADAAIAEIKRRADSGEFTPVKGVDYFTEAEKNELMESVSSGAIGEFRKVVDSATTEYNDNHNLKLAKYNANASEKLTTYDTNDEQRTSDYNRNAEVKLEAYNSNHTEKLTEYNTNAETKTAEFDSNAAALQTEVDRLRGECDNLAAENRKQENRISALMKLNKGQTYDILPEEGESASRTAPSGAKYVSVDKIGGKSIVWNQLFNMSQNNRVDGGQFEINFESQTVTLNGNSGNNAWLSIIPDDGAFAALNVKNHQYIYKISVVENQSAEDIRFGFLNRGFVANIPANYTGRVNFLCTVSDPEKGKSIGFSGLQPNTDYAVRLVLSACDLTLMFGAGHEPTAEQFEAMFPEVSYPYNAGEIISKPTAEIEIDVQSPNIFPGTELDRLYPCEIKKGETFTASARFEISGTAKCRYFTADKAKQDYYSLTSDVATHDENTRYKKVIEAPFDIAFVEFYAATGKTATDFVVELGEGDGKYKQYLEQKNFSIVFKELRSAMAAHDYIDMDGGQVIRNIGKIKFRDIKTKDFEGDVFYIHHSEIGAKEINARCLTPGFAFVDEELVNINPRECNGRGYYFRFKVPAEIDTVDKFMEKYGDDDIYFELETPTTEPVTIPEALQEWLPVEPGGTVTFRNSDETKQLAVPNGVSWVRKLDEVE